MLRTLFGFAKQDVHPSTIGAPSVLVLADTEVFVCVSEAAIVLLLVAIRLRAGNGVAYPPETIDETISFSVRVQGEKILLLVGADYVGNLNLNPMLVDGRKVFD
jgi:hypothetical protein